MNNNLDKIVEVLQANGIVCRKRKMLGFIDSVRVKKENTNLNIINNKRTGSLSVNAGTSILYISLGVIATVILFTCSVMFIKGLSFIDSLSFVSALNANPYIGGGLAGQGIYVYRKRNIVLAMEEELKKMMEKGDTKGC